jgi:hypothetical protein
MVAWKNLDTLESFAALLKTKGSVKLAEAMAGEVGLGGGVEGAGEGIGTGPSRPI